MPFPFKSLVRTRVGVPVPAIVDIHNHPWTVDTYMGSIVGDIVPAPVMIPVTVMTVIMVMPVIMVSIVIMPVVGPPWTPVPGIIAIVPM